MEYGLKQIAKGICITHQQRVAKVNLLNQQIESIADAIKSSSDADGMPHGNDVTDPVSSRMIRIERIEEERDAEQTRINAVEWANQWLYDNYDEDVAKTLLVCINLDFKRDHNVSNKLLEDFNIAKWSYQRARSEYFKQIIRFLHLALN